MLYGTLAATGAGTADIHPTRVLHVALVMDESLWRIADCRKNTFHSRRNGRCLLIY